MQVFETDYPRGKCEIRVFGESGGAAAPIVLMFPDAFGPREASFAVASELAGEGWRVLMPDNFYEFRPFDPIDPAGIFSEGPGDNPVMEMFASVTQEKIDDDVAALIAFADAQFGTQAPLGVTGYCMGARYALTAACMDGRVRFAAAIHGSTLAPVDLDGPHRRFASAKGRIYVGVSSIDPFYEPAEHGRLAEALRAADTDHTIETYHGVAHGFVFSDLPVYDEGASSKHLRRLKENMSELFASSGA